MGTNTPEGAAMIDIQPIDDDEVFYQAKHKAAEMWQSCSKEDYSDFLKMPWMDVRILWTTGAVLNKLSTAFRHQKEKHVSAIESLRSQLSQAVSHIEILMESEHHVRHYPTLKADLELFVAEFRNMVPK